MDEQANKVEVEQKRYRSFTVTPGLCGFEVVIGCSKAFFASAEQLADAIRQYLYDPQGTERKFQRGDIRLNYDPVATGNFEEVPGPRLRDERPQESPGYSFSAGR